MGWDWIIGAPSALQGGENLHGAGQGREWHGSSLPFLDLREKRRGNDEGAKKGIDKCV